MGLTTKAARSLYSPGPQKVLDRAFAVAPGEHAEGASASHTWQAPRVVSMK